MRLNKYFIYLLLSIVFLSHCINAKDIGIKWGMSKKQVMRIEGTNNNQVLREDDTTTIWYDYKNESGITTSMSVYMFNKNLDSLKIINVFYEGYYDKSLSYDNLVKFYTTQYGQEIYKYEDKENSKDPRKNIGWLYKDSTTFILLKYITGETTMLIISPIRYKDFYELPCQISNKISKHSDGELHWIKSNIMIYISHTDYNKINALRLIENQVDRSGLHTVEISNGNTIIATDDISKKDNWMIAIWAIILLQALILGGFCSFIAKEKGRNAGRWFFLGFLFSVLAILALIAVPRQENKTAIGRKQIDNKVNLSKAICPFCREEISPGSVLCKHCKSDLTEKRPIIINQLAG